MAKKVLVVDDEKLIVKGIRFSLEQDGMEVDCAYDGEEAYNMAKTTEYDMILLDVMLPKMDGFEVCRAIREFSDMPIVMLTAKDTVTIWVNMLITALANFVCVWIIKFVEEKARKDKLWLVKITIPKEHFEKAKFWLKTWEIPYSYVDIEKYVVFDTYCATQKDTKFAIKVCNMFNGKKFATESKL